MGAKFQRMPAALAPIVRVNDRSHTTCMEQLQEAYVGAIASAAGFTIQPIARDINCVDLEVILPATNTEPEDMIKFQLKNTTLTRVDPTKTSFSYRFKKKRHADVLTMPRGDVKLILLVMSTGRNQNDWVANDHDKLSVIHGSYWVNLENVTVPTSLRISVPIANILTPASLTAMFARRKQGLPI